MEYVPPRVSSITVGVDVDVDVDIATRVEEEEEEEEDTGVKKNGRGTCVVVKAAARPRRCRSRMDVRPALMIQRRYDDVDGGTNTYLRRERILLPTLLGQKMRHSQPFKEKNMRPRRARLYHQG